VGCQTLAITSPLEAQSFSGPSSRAIGHVNSRGLVQQMAEGWRLTCSRNFHIICTYILHGPAKHILNPLKYWTASSKCSTAMVSALKCSVSGRLFLSLVRKYLFPLLCNRRSYDLPHLFRTNSLSSVPDIVGESKALHRMHPSRKFQTHILLSKSVKLEGGGSAEGGEAIPGQFLSVLVEIWLFFPCTEDIRARS
jgi:hypothetical protein